MDNLFIRKLSYFGSLNESDRAALRHIDCRAREVKAHHELIREGDPPGPFLIFLKGWGARSKLVRNGQRQIVGLLMPGDSCDLHANAVAEMDHSIGTLTASTVATINRAELDQLLEDHPKVLRALYVSQLIDEGICRAWIVGMGRRSSRERLAHLMCELYMRGQNVGLADENQMSLPLTQELLADTLGLTSVHINRVLRDLRADQVMDIRHGALEINDASLLTRIAGFDENYLHRRLNQPQAVAGVLR